MHKQPCVLRCELNVKPIRDVNLNSKCVTNEKSIKKGRSRKNEPTKRTNYYFYTSNGVIL